MGICMLNSGAIRTAIDERYKDGTSVVFLQSNGVLHYKGHFALAAVVVSFYNQQVFALIFRFHNYGGDPHRPTIWRNL